MAFAGQPLSSGERRILEELQRAKDRHAGNPSEREWLSNKRLLELADMFPSNLAKFLRRLRVERGFIERDPETREYMILELGVAGLKRSDDMGISFASKNAYFKDLEPSNEVVAPRILPVQAAVYMNEEIATATEEVAKQEGVKTTEVRDRLLSDLARETASAFEEMLRQRFYRLVDSWETYKIQQMSPSDRDKHFRAYGWTIEGKKVALDQNMRTFVEIYLLGNLNMDLA